jgi:hypothetical protein
MRLVGAIAWRSWLGIFTVAGLQTASVTSGQSLSGLRFKYQGQVKQAGQALDGTADLEFSLWDAANAGAQVGSSFSARGVPVRGGSFTTDLDFGVSPPPSNAPCWLQVAVRSPAWNGLGEAPSFTVLSPRQAVSLPSSPSTSSTSSTSGVGYLADGPNACQAVEDLDALEWSLACPIGVLNGRLWCAMNGATLAAWDGTQFVNGGQGAPSAGVTNYWVNPSGVYIGARIPPTSGPLNLYRSADGTAPFSLVLDATTHGVGSLSGVPRSLCYVGPTRGHPDGVVFYFEYAAGAGAMDEGRPKLWASADNGATWTFLFQCASGAIRHFHGATYVPNYDHVFGSAEGRLYVYTGDGNGTTNNPVLLLCDDVDDLIANPNAWRDYWGLSDNTRSTLRSTRSVGQLTEYPKYRTVGFVDGGDGYGYWGEDAGSPTGLRFWRVNHATRAVTQVGGTVTGTAWQVLKTSKNRILFATDSEGDKNGPFSGYDYNLRLCEVSRDGTQFTEIWKRRRANGGVITGACTVTSLVEAFGRIFFTVCNGEGLQPSYPTVTPERMRTHSGFGGQPCVPLRLGGDALLVTGRTNLCTNPRFLQGSGSNVPGWSPCHAVHAIETDGTYFDPQGNGAPSLRVTGAGNTTQNFSTYPLNAATRTAVSGKLLTAVVRMRMPASCVDGQTPLVGISTGGGSGGTSSNWLASSSDFTGTPTWLTVMVTARVPVGATSVALNLSPNWTTNWTPNMVPVWFSDVRITVGGVPGAPNQ